MDVLRLPAIHVGTPVVDDVRPEPVGGRVEAARGVEDAAPEEFLAAFDALERNPRLVGVGRAVGERMPDSPGAHHYLEVEDLARRDLRRAVAQNDHVVSTPNREEVDGQDLVLQELPDAALRVGARTYEPLPPFLFALVLYSVIVFVLVRTQRMLELRQPAESLP